MSGIGASPASGAHATHATSGSNTGKRAAPVLAKVLILIALGTVSIALSGVTMGGSPKVTVEGGIKLGAEHERKGDDYKEGGNDRIVRQLGSPSLRREGDGAPHLKRDEPTAVVTTAAAATSSSVALINGGLSNGVPIRRIGLASGVASSVEGLGITEGRLGLADSGAQQQQQQAVMSRFALQPFTPIYSEDGSMEIGLRVSLGQHGVGAGGTEDLIYPAFKKQQSSAEGSDGVSSSSFTEEDREAIKRIAPHLGPHCPLERYVTVNTHTWGRHHNQLQEIMNTIAWAERLNRTAILSFFRFDHAWHGVENFYNFTAIQQRYCVVTLRQASEILQIREKKKDLPKLTSRCLGQGMKATRFKHMTNTVRCPSKLDLPAHYNARHSVRISKRMIEKYVLSNNDGFLMLSGQIAFYMRPGIWDTVRLFRHLRPSAEVEANVNAELLTNFFSGTADARPSSSSSSVTEALRARQVPPSALSAITAVAPPARRPDFAVYPYFSIHSRSREQDCLLEMGYDEADNDGFLASMGKGGDGGGLSGGAFVWTDARKQCRIGSGLVDRILAATAPVNGTLLFLASDGQNQALETAMQRRGAIKVADKKYAALMGMAVDYFLMSRGTYFTGNQLSSVSQNVCFLRLGNGLTCDGWYPIWTLYHARHALSTSIGAPPAS